MPSFTREPWVCDFADHALAYCCGQGATLENQPIGFLVDLPWVWSASDDEASGPWHAAADPTALLPLQSDRILSPQL